MFDRVRGVVLRALRVPAEPTPPFGAPGSIRIFRAGQSYYRLRLIRWGIAQSGAAIGLIISVVILHSIFREARVAVQTYDERSSTREAAQARAQKPAPPGAASASPATVAPATPSPAVAVPNAAAPEPARSAKPGKTKREFKSQADFNRAAGQELGSRVPLWIINALEVLKLFGVLLFIVQLPFSYAAVRLEYEQHWYIVTDRSLRIRRGLVSMLESTMSFANIQQVVVQQGPLQRLLGLADVRVQSAGGGSGGGSPHERKGADESLHTGVFHGVENAEEIRDLILERLRNFRQAGLGDPDDPHQAPARAMVVHPAAPTAVDEATLAAARELVAEARALRSALG